MSEQNTLGLDIDPKIDSVENFKFEPIKGYPMLHWKGKRPFTSTQFYPAQLKETHGVEVNGWLNKIFWGDNLQVMSHLLKEFRGQVDLIYIDPPYDSKADYKKKIKLKGREVLNDNTSFEEKQYTDIWSNDEYLQFIYERLLIIKELLKSGGSLWVHLDWRKSHHLKLILDEVFGPSNFVNEIVWKSTTFAGSSKTIANKFSVNNNSLFWYCKGGRYTFNKQYKPYDPEYLKRFKNPDNDPKGPWQSNALATYSEETFKRLKDNGELILPKTPGAGYRYKFYLSEAKGRIIETIWDDIYLENPMAKVRTNYPTQKPEALLERIILSTSNPGDLVFDCFMGSGTTQAVAMKLGRRFIGADINLGAIQTTTKRLITAIKEINETIQEEDKYTGFQVYNVNNYDVFRNPVEAKDLLIKALEIQPLPNNSIYDGEKDGRMVKIMPVNRIATRADLNELITNFDYKKFEKINSENPKKPVEEILLVCMGHEPTLAAELKNSIQYPIDVEVVDILRDKSNLEFKRDSEAEVVIEGGKLLIREFYPMNLLQKLSLQKENVENWRELTDSVMVDFNYDGAVFEPQIVDVPEKNDFVKGVYDIPSNSGTIRVKITDVLSETIELTVEN